MVEPAMAPRPSGALSRLNTSLLRLPSVPGALFCTHHHNLSCPHMHKGNFLTDPQQKPPPQVLHQQYACLPSTHYATLLQSCSSANSVFNGYLAHDLIVKSSVDRTTFLQNLLIQMYGQFGYVEHACALFFHMHLPDQYSSNFIIKCFAQQDQAALQEGNWLHSCAAENGSDACDIMRNALLTMYGRCGNLADARAMFDKAHARNLALWNAMIEIHAQNGHGKDALELFSQIGYEKVIPNEATFVSVLSACSHSGLVDEAYAHLLSMSCDYGIIVEADHYNCMVDLLGRVGRLEEAEKIILNMPCRPTSVSWLTLLSSCREHVDVVRGEYAAEWASVLDSENTAPHVILSNLYFAVGREEDSARVIQRMREMESMTFGTTFLAKDDSCFLEWQMDKVL